MRDNPLGLDGIGFVEFSTEKPEALSKLFLDLGFSKVARHSEKDVEVFRQGDIFFLLNHHQGSFGDRFRAQHGPSISSMGWRVEDPERAHALALKRGARDAGKGD